MNLKAMDVPALLKLQADVETALADKRKELERQLAQLSGKKEVHHLKGRKVAAKYRSLKDTSLQWAGRGAKPKWLVAEMKASKKKLADFAL